MTDLAERIAELTGLEGLIPEQLAGLQVLEVPSGTVLFAPGDDCQGLPILIRGAIEVWLSHSSGREMLWYKIEAGEPCLASTSAMLSGDVHCASARVASPAELIVIPTAVVESLMGESRDFREFLLRGYVRRWHSALDRLYGVAFLGIEQRLAHLLLEASGGLELSHQEIADRLGSAPGSRTKRGRYGLGRQDPKRDRRPAAIASGELPRTTRKGVRLKVKRKST